MNDTAKLTSLRDRLVEDQRKLVKQAASQGVLPTTGMMGRVADLESTLPLAEYLHMEACPA